MKRTSLCCISILAIFCLSLIWLRPIQALNTQAPAGSAAQSDHAGRLPRSGAALAGHWMLQTTGDAVDIDESDGRLTARIGGVEWELSQAGQSLTATRTLSGEEARRLFPDIADAAAALSGNKVTLVLVEAADGTSIDMSLTISAKGSRRLARQGLSLMSGSLTRLTGDANPDGSDRNGAELLPQALGTPTMSVAPSIR